MDKEKKSQPESGAGASIGDEITKELPSIPAIALEVIKNPVGFYKKMPKTGGFLRAGLCGAASLRLFDNGRLAGVPRRVEGDLCFPRAAV